MVFIPNNRSHSVFQASEITPSVCNVSTPNLCMMSKEPWERGESTNTGIPSVCDVSTPNLSILNEEFWEGGESTNTGISWSSENSVNPHLTNSCVFQKMTSESESESHPMHVMPQPPIYPFSVINLVKQMDPITQGLLISIKEVI